VDQELAETLVTNQGVGSSIRMSPGVKRYLRVAEFRTLRTRLVARAQAEGINTDNDVFEVLQKK